MSGPITVAPTGFRLVSVGCENYVNLEWNKLTPPSGEGPVTGYVIAYGPTSGSQDYKYTVGPDETTVTIAGVGGGAAGKHYFELSSGSSHAVTTALLAQLTQYALSGTLPDGASTPIAPSPPTLKCLGSPNVSVP